METDSALEQQTNSKEKSPFKNNRKFISKSLDSLTNLTSNGAINGNDLTPFYAKTNSTIQNPNSTKLGPLPNNINKIQSPHRQLYDASQGLAAQQLSGGSKLGGSQGNLSNFQKILVQTNTKLPYLSHSLGSLQVDSKT